MVVSVSKIQTFQQCPYKYKLAYIDHVQQLIPECFSKGSDIHALLEKINTNEITQETKYNDVVFKFLNSSIGIKYFNAIKNGQHEVKIGLKVDGCRLVPCNFYDAECIFHGIIDVLHENLILDYKTGKAKAFKDQNWMQLMFYAAWLFLSADYQSITISYLYIEHDKENSLIISRDLLPNILKKLVIRVQEILRFETNPTEDHKESKLCEYCTCREQCKFYQEHLKFDLALVPFEAF